MSESETCKQGRSIEFTTIKIVPRVLAQFPRYTIPITL